MSMEVPGMLPGEDRIGIWDTIKGKIIKSKVQKLDEGDFRLQLPEVEKAPAFKVYRL